MNSTRDGWSYDSGCRSSDDPNYPSPEHEGCDHCVRPTRAAPLAWLRWRAARKIASFANSLTHRIAPRFPRWVGGAGGSRCL